MKGLSQLFWIAVTFWLLASISTIHAQTATPSLSIISPSSGTVVEPGRSIEVIVSVPVPGGLTTEAILGSGSLGGIYQIQPAGSELTFTITIPQNTVPGRYFITAVGKLTSGGTISSPPFTLVVPISGVLSLRANLKTLVLNSAGDQGDLYIEGVTAQETIPLDLQTVSYVSSNPGVASVSISGQVIANGVGTATINVTYGAGSSAVSATVNVIVRGGLRGDINGDGQVDVDDLNLLDMTLNSATNGPNDARDLNHDGVINVLDARILTTLCTYPHCATHP